MHIKYLTAVFIISLISQTPALVRAETICLKSGKIYQGEVTAHNDSEIEIWTEDGIVQIPYRMIESIDRSPEDSTAIYPLMEDLQAQFTKIKKKSESRSYVHANSRGSGKVELYMTNWCPYCQKMEKYLRENKIKYVKYNIDYDQAARARYKEMGGDGVPLVKVGDIIIRGYSPAAVSRAVR